MKRTLLLAASAAVLAAPTIAQELPPGNPLPGECFARVIVPAQYSTSTEQIVLRQAGEEIRKIPGRFETVTERVLVQEESFEIVPVGSGTRTGTFRANGTTYYVDSVGNVFNSSAAAAASSGGASGSGAGGLASGSLGRIDGNRFVGSNGSTIANNVSVAYSTSGRTTGGQPTYRTVTETVVVQEASTELVAIPAVYGTETETVQVQAASVEYTTIPVSYTHLTLPTIYSV